MVSFASGDSSTLIRLGLALFLVGALAGRAHAADPDDVDGTAAPAAAPGTAPAAPTGGRTPDAAEAAPAEPIIVVEEPDPRALPPGVTVAVNVGTGAGAPPAEPAADPGTHFIFEVGLGASFGGGFGFAADALFGWGGKPFGIPLRFYVFAEVAHLSNEASGSIEAGLYQNAHRYLDLALGLRTYVPIYGALRFFADASIGAALNTARLERSGFLPLEEEGWYAAISLGGGLQLRIFPGLSLGARVRVLFTDDDLSSTRTALHIDDTTPFDFTGTVSWHF